MDTHPPAPLPAPSRAHGSGSGSGDSRGAGRGPMAKRVTREAEMPVREYQAELGYIVRVSPVLHRIKVGFVPGMRVPGLLVLNDSLKALVLTELERYCTDPSAVFLPACKQVANVAALPGIVGTRWRCPMRILGTGSALGTWRRLTWQTQSPWLCPGASGSTSTAGCGWCGPTLWRRTCGGWWTRAVGSVCRTGWRRRSSTTSLWGLGRSG